MRAVLWCNGSIPSEEVLESAILPGDPVYGVDGGAINAVENGYQVVEAIGDLDSIDVNSWEGGLVPLADQSSSDLVKSISLLVERGFEQIEVVGVDGGSPDHILGNWAALLEAPGGPSIRLHHEEGVTHRFHPSQGELEINMESGSTFSVFALETAMVWIEGAKWEISGEELSLSTRGLSNEGLGKCVYIKSTGILAVVFRK